MKLLLFALLALAALGPVSSQQDGPDPTPVVWVTLMPSSPGSSATSGGRQSMHSVHDEINRAYAAGELDVRSVLINPTEELLSKYSNATDRPLLPNHITPYDYFLSPERRQHLPRWHLKSGAETGALNLVYYLGQHSAGRGDTMELDGYKQLCRTNYLGSLYRCARKALLVAPMSPLVYAEAEAYRALPAVQRPKKEALVLLDPDNSGVLDLAKVKLPEGVRLVPMEGFTRAQVLDLYKKSKVFVDPFITGIERANFESALFDNVAIVAHHGNALEPRDFPIPEPWRWQPHNYTQLSELIRRGIEEREVGLAAMQGMRKWPYDVRDRFPGAVVEYFQDDVHVMLFAYAGPTVNGHLPGLSAALGLVVTGALYPFASHEVVCASPYFWQFDYAHMLRFHARAAGIEHGLSATQMGKVASALQPGAGLYIQPPQARHKRRYAVVIPPGVLPVHPGLMRALFKAIRQQKADAVVGPGGLLIVRRATYYGTVRAHTAAALQAAAGLETLTEIMRAAGLRVGSLDAAALATEERPGSALAGCGAATLALFEPLPEAGRCLCPWLRELLRDRLVVSGVLQLPRPDEERIRGWFDVLLDACAGTAAQS